MENILEINMEENNNFVLLNSLAMKCLNREEYADFLTVMQKIRDRSIHVLEYLKDNPPTEDTIRYPHDLELILKYKLYQNNQKGERVELKEYSEIPLLVKIPLDKDAKTTVKTICDYILGLDK